MTWKLTFQLSLFGLAMAIATISWIPSDMEPFFWLVIFIVCAFLIAKRASAKYFLHGLVVSIFNSIWITALHVIFYDTYMVYHPELAEMPFGDPSPLRMAMTGPVIGIVSGLVLGLFAFVASRIVKK